VDLDQVMVGPTASDIVESREAGLATGDLK
jgi:hypothetical protein